MLATGCMHTKNHIMEVYCTILFRKYMLVNKPRCEKAPCTHTFLTITHDCFSESRLSYLIQSDDLMHGVVYFIIDCPLNSTNCMVHSLYWFTHVWHEEACRKHMFTKTVVFWNWYIHLSNCHSYAHTTIISITSSIDTWVKRDYTSNEAITLSFDFIPDSTSPKLNETQSIPGDQNTHTHTTNAARVYELPKLFKLWLMPHSINWRNSSGKYWNWFWNSSVKTEKNDILVLWIHSQE